MRLAKRARMACAPGFMAVVLALAPGTASGHAQIISEAAPQTTEDALHAMAQQAAVIFAGQVIAVRRLEGMNGATGVVEIEFAVDDAVRGVSGSSYTLREWAGLWTAGDQPLRAGQRYLMLLNAPSAAGLSSPVGGMDGAIPIRGDDIPTAEPLRAVSRVAGAAVPVDARMVDLRWVATRVVRRVSYAANSTVRPTALPIGVRANVFTGGTAREPEPASNAPGSEAADAALPVIAPEAQDAGYAAVLALLRGWEKSGHGAR